MEPRRSAEGTATTADRLAARLVEGLPVTTRRLDLAGVSTSLIEGGEGPPMVVLHGQGGFAEIMGGLVATLVDRYRVIAPDLPGLGRSVVQNGTLDTPGVVKWLGELIAKSCDQPPILLGVSLGGSVAARFAVERGDEVSKLILVDSGSLGPFRPPPSLLFALIRLIRKPDRAGVRRMQRQIFHNVDRVRSEMGVWVPETRFTGHAARSYSWMRPPRTSRLITDAGAAPAAKEGRRVGVGAFMSSAGWGRWPL